MQYATEMQFSATITQLVIPNSEDCHHQHHKWQQQHQAAISMKSSRWHMLLTNIETTLLY